MKRKLKTWEQFEKEFKPLAEKWEEYANGNIFIKCSNVYWCIRPKMRKYFGTKIEVHGFNLYHPVYTHKGHNHAWHESWFEPEFEEIEFISKEEIVI